VEAWSLLWSLSSQMSSWTSAKAVLAPHRQCRRHHRQGEPAMGSAMASAIRATVMAAAMQAAATVAAMAWGGLVVAVQVGSAVAAMVVAVRGMRSV